MDEDNNNRRLLLASALMLAVLVVWQWLTPARRPAPDVVQEGVAQTATAAATQTSSAAVASAETSSTTAKPTQNIEPKFFTFKGRVPEVQADEAVPYDLVLTNVGGGIEHFELPSYKERDRQNHKTDKSIELANAVEGRRDLQGQMAGLTFVGGTTFKMPAVPVYEVVESGPDHVRYRFVTHEGVEIEREYQLNPTSFQLEMAVTVRNGSRTPQSEQLQLSAALRVDEAMLAGGGFLSKFVPPPDHLAAICRVQNSVERSAYQALIKDGGSPKEFGDNARWAAIDRQYFLAAMIPRDGSPAECRLSANEQTGVATASIRLPAVTLKPGEERRHKFTAYLGVKKPSQLTMVNADLESAIEYTYLGLDLSVLCQALLWVLSVFHGWFGSWGIAILCLTILVKLMLFPLNQRQGRSMRAMAALKPHMDEIRKRHADDRQRQNEEVLRLYKEHNVNPAGGCLPTLIQMPVWFALYRSLWVSVDLYQQPFLWIPDLTASDPLKILPLLMIAVMFLQQRTTPTTMDPAQAKVMQYTMPLMFGAMMMALPAGLCFYMLVNMLLTIVQQHFINRSIGPIGGSASVQGVTA